MSDALSFAEIDGQHVELLAARTVLSLFSVGGTPKGGDAGAAPAGVTGGPGGEGGDAKGKAVFSHNWFYLEDGNVTNTVTGAAGGSADGGAATGGAGAAR